MKRKKVGKALFKSSFFIIITIVMLVILFNGNDVDELSDVFAKADKGYFWGSFGLLLVYIVLNPVSLYILMRDKESKIGFGKVFMVGSVEHFFNGVTPSNTGGQPMEILCFKKAGVSASKSTGALLINFIANQIAIVILCLFSLFYYKELSKGSTAIEVLIVIGLTMNILIAVIFFSLGYFKCVRRVLENIIKWFTSFKIFRGKLDSLNDKFSNYCTDAQKAFKDILASWIKFIFVIICRLITLAVLYTLPFFILKALNVDISYKKLALVGAMTTFSIAMTCFIPTPGSSGGIEFAFKNLFMNLAGVTAATAVSGMIIWRLMTYYLLMLISFCIYILFEIIFKEKKDIEPIKDTQVEINDKNCDIIKEEEAIKEEERIE